MRILPGGDLETNKVNNDTIIYKSTNQDTASDSLWQLPANDYVSTEMLVNQTTSSESIWLPTTNQTREEWERYVDCIYDVKKELIAKRAIMATYQ